MISSFFGRSGAPPLDDLDWQVLPQQQHQRGGGAEGTGDPGPGGNGGDSREGAISRGGRSRSAGVGSRSRSRGVNTGRGKNPGRGYTGLAAQPGGRGMGRGATTPGGHVAGGQPGGLFAGLNQKLAAMMEPDLENMRPGALGLVPGMNMAMGIGMAMHDLGEYLGLEMGPPSEQATAPSHGSPQDFLEPPGEAAAEGTPAPEPMDPEAERQKQIRRGLDWYRNLMGPGGWAPGTTA